MYSPDERRSIRAEMNRDAAPSPDELERMHRNRTCEHCGEDNDDGETITRAARYYYPDCPAVQKPTPDPIDLCPDCLEDHDPEGAWLDDLHARDATYARYECGAVHAAEYPEEHLIDMGDGEMAEHPHGDYRDRIPVECECGADLDTIVE